MVHLNYTLLKRFILFRQNWKLKTHTDVVSDQMYRPRVSDSNPRRYRDEIPPELRYWNTFTHADISKQHIKLFDMQPTVEFDFEI